MHPLVAATIANEIANSRRDSARQARTAPRRSLVRRIAGR